MACHGVRVIASIAFRNFKALRNTRLELAPFNLVIGPNGSGKTSLIDALLRLRTLAPGALSTDDIGAVAPGDSELRFTFAPPDDGIQVSLGCSGDWVCNTARVQGATPERWSGVAREIARIRAYLFNHYAMSAPVAHRPGEELASDGGNVAAVLADLRDLWPESFAALEVGFCRILPEYRALHVRELPGNRVELAAVLRHAHHEVSSGDLSQGTLYVAALLALAYSPHPPSVVCIEEIDRGIHPRKLREIRDVLYRMSHPTSVGLTRPPVQVITTTHSPYLVDLFKDQPEEVVLADKADSEATFVRLADRPDIQEMLAEAPLGDLWLSGVLGGVPEEPTDGGAAT